MMPSPRHRLRQAGFTLLEAIVAMVLIGGAGLALFGWINGSVASLRRVQDANARSEAMTNVLEYMERVNPMLRPEGMAPLGRYSIRWRARPITAIVDGVNYPSGIGLYQIALYGTTVSVLSEGERAWFELQLRQVGYKQVRSVAVHD